MTTWLDLARRAQEAEGGARELDSTIAVHAGVVGWPLSEWQAVLADPVEYPRPVAIPAAPAVTASVDAVLALVAEKLPDWMVDGLRQEDDDWIASLDLPDPFMTRRARGKTPATAMLACFCLAMAAKAGEREGVDA